MSPFEFHEFDEEEFCWCASILQTVIGAVAVGLMSVLGFAFYLTRSSNQRSLRMTESSSFNDALSTASRENILKLTDQIKGDRPSAVENQHQQFEMKQQQVLGDGVRSNNMTSIKSNKIIKNQSHGGKDTNGHDTSTDKFGENDIMHKNNGKSNMKESGPSIMLKLYEGKDSPLPLSINNINEFDTAGRENVLRLSDQPVNGIITNELAEKENSTPLNTSETSETNGSKVHFAQKNNDIGDVSVKSSPQSNNIKLQNYEESTAKVERNDVKSNEGETEKNIALKLNTENNSDGINDYKQNEFDNLDSNRVIENLNDNINKSSEEAMKQALSFEVSTIAEKGNSTPLNTSETSETNGSKVHFARKNNDIDVDDVSVKSSPQSNNIKLKNYEESTAKVERNDVKSNEGETETNIALKLNTENNSDGINDYKQNEFDNLDSNRVIENLNDNINKSSEEAMKQALSFEVSTIDPSESTSSDVTNKTESNESQIIKQRSNSVKEMINNIEQSNYNNLENIDEIGELKKKTMRPESADIKSESQEKSTAKDINRDSEINEEQLNQRSEKESIVSSGQNSPELVKKLNINEEPNTNYGKNGATNSGGAKSDSASMSGKTSETSSIKEHGGSKRDQLFIKAKDIISSVGPGIKNSVSDNSSPSRVQLLPCPKAKSNACCTAKLGCSVCIDVHETKNKLPCRETKSWASCVASQKSGCSVSFDKQESKSLLPCRKSKSSASCVASRKSSGSVCADAKKTKSKK